VSEREETAALELLLMDAEVVAWLEDYRPPPDEAEDDEPPAAA
jgi:hypothetical protein